MRGKNMDFKDTMRLLVASRLCEMSFLLGGYTEMLPDIVCAEACAEVIADIKKAQDLLDGTTYKLHIQDLLSEDKK